MLVTLGVVEATTAELGEAVAAKMEMPAGEVSKRVRAHRQAVRVERRRAHDSPLCKEVHVFTARTVYRLQCVYGGTV